jgi:2-amino-4-hydroxy-6-hydroxymethyldihydropteridine diphosphokinase
VARVFLGLGSNLGDRAANLAYARSELEAAGMPVCAASTVEETEPVGPVAQGPFLNQVVEVATELAPRALLAVLKAIERRAGRAADGVRWGPRMLDIDILLYGDIVIESDDLTVPHPEMLERDFVLRELREIDESLRDPRTGDPV